MAGFGEIHSRRRDHRRTGGESLVCLLSRSHAPKINCATRTTVPVDNPMSQFNQWQAREWPMGTGGKPGGAPILSLSADVYAWGVAGGES